MYSGGLMMSNKLHCSSTNNLNDIQSKLDQLDGKSSSLLASSRARQSRLRTRASSRNLALDSNQVEDDQDQPHYPYDPLDCYLFAQDQEYQHPLKQAYREETNFNDWINFHTTITTTDNNNKITNNNTTTITQQEQIIKSPNTNNHHHQNHNQNNNEVSATNLTTTSNHYLTLEDLKCAFKSCSTCGCNWQEEHVSLDCPECGGFGLSRPCPECNGECQQVWQRDLSATHDLNKAQWKGKCAIQEQKQVANQMALILMQFPIGELVQVANYIKYFLKHLN